MSRFSSPPQLRLALWGLETPGCIGVDACLCLAAACVCTNLIIAAIAAAAATVAAPDAAAAAAATAATAAGVARRFGGAASVAGVAATLAVMRAAYAQRLLARRAPPAHSTAAWRRRQRARRRRAPLRRAGRGFGGERVHGGSNERSPFRGHMRRPDDETLQCEWKGFVCGVCVQVRVRVAGSGPMQGVAHGFCPMYLGAGYLPSGAGLRGKYAAGLRGRYAADRKQHD
eukprot:365192-Chlamydomonas_euryale.AAC.13